MKKNNKDICARCKQSRVLLRNYLTGEHVCNKCDKVVRHEERRKTLLNELRLLNRNVPDLVSNAEIEDILQQYNVVSRYIKSVFECLTGQRPVHVGIDNKEIDNISKILAQQLPLFERIAALQKKRAEIGYSRMDMASKRLRSDNYKYIYTGEFEPALIKNEEFSAVEAVLRRRFPEAIPLFPPAKRSYNKTIMEDVPEGMAILYHEVEIAGLHNNRDESIRFCKGSSQAVVLRRDYNNSVDDNAIQVFGHFLDGKGPTSVFLGFVPAKTAAEIAKKKQWGSISALMYRMWISETDYVKIVIDIIGPESLAK